MSGRVLAVATLHSGEASGVAICGTSDGKVVALDRSSLAIIREGTLPLVSECTSAPSSSAAPPRATALAAIDDAQAGISLDNEHQRGGRFVVGDSDGGLHVCLLYTSPSPRD